MMQTAQQPIEVTQCENQSSGKSPIDTRLPRFILACLMFVLILALLPEDVFDLARLGGQECSKIDAITGFIHLKNKRIIWKQEGFSTDKTNAFGFLDKDYAVRKPPGVFRIACLGDSMTESLQVPQDERFTSLLEANLNKTTPAHFEVLNFGVSAAGTGQEYLTYLAYIRQFHPDLVLLFFDSGDEDKNGRKPFMSQWHPHVAFGLQGKNLVASWRDFDAWTESVQAMPVVLFEQARIHNRAWGMFLQALNTVKTSDAFTAFVQLLDRVHLRISLEDSLRALFPTDRFGAPAFQSRAVLDSLRQSFCKEHGIIWGDSKPQQKIRFDEKDFEFGADPIYHTSQLSAQQKLEVKRREDERWRLTEALLLKLSNDCKSDGTKLVVFGFPAMVSKEGFDFAFQKIGSLADNKQFFAANLTPAFDQQCTGLNDSPRIICHLSDSGHRALANVVMKYLTENHLLAP